MAACSTRFTVPVPLRRWHLLISDSLGCARSWRGEASDFAWGLGSDRGTVTRDSCLHMITMLLAH